MVKFSVKQNNVAITTLSLYLKGSCQINLRMIRNTSFNGLFTGQMIDVSAADRAGTPDKVGTVGALLMGPEGTFITVSDFLMDGGVTATYWFGELAS